MPCVEGHEVLNPALPDDDFDAAADKTLKIILGQLELLQKTELQE